MLTGQIPLESIREELFDEKGLTVSMLRLDLVHPVISGNKWFKLKYNLDAFIREEKKFLVTMGGAFSNHIMATAATGKEKGIATAGIIRGEELTADSNEALRYAAGCGMKLFFVTRDEYKNIRQTEILPDRISAELKTPVSALFFLPEGGSNALAVKGCEEIVHHIPEDFDFITCAVGTGTTLAGISTALKEAQTAIGISVLEGKDFLEKNILELNAGRKNFRLVHEFSFGGYAKSNNELVNFCSAFSRRHGIAIEPVYTGKMLFGLYQLIQKNEFKRDTRIVAVHTGGLGV